MDYTFALHLLFTAMSTPLYFSLSASTAPDRFFKPFHRLSAPQEFIELAHPLPTDHVTSACTHTLLRNSFADTINKPPFTTPYHPPCDCPGPWARIILEFHATCKGEQYDRIAGLWLGGTELLRTSTAEPSQSGIFWTVRKDITRYSSLLVQSNLDVTMMLENVVNDIYTGVYHVNCTLYFYKYDAFRVPSIFSPRDFNSKLGFESDKYYAPPADLIIPVADDGQRGYWFRIENASDSKFNEVKFPLNAYRVVMELYVSFHGNDEFWYSNPPNSYLVTNNLPTGRGNGNFREVFVTIDGKLVASEFPMPVIFTGGINPLLWEPIVAIGAFDLPTYDIDLTPILGMVLDGKEHEIGIGVTDAISYWLVNANLHIWLDHSVYKVQAMSSVYHYPDLNIRRGEVFSLLDGRFQIDAKRKTNFVGWVKSSSGNLTTAVVRQFRIKTMIKFDKNGTYKWVNQKVKVMQKAQVSNETQTLVTRVTVRRRYPLNVVTSTLPGLKEDTYLLRTNVSQSIREKCTGDFQISVANSQVSMGWMEVKDHSVLSGEANTKQSYSYRDAFTWYIRDVFARNGELISDPPKSSASSF